MEYQKLDDLKYIKKHYGEKMSHLCRDLFPSLLERPGYLYHLLTTHFNPSKSLYYDIINENKEFNFKEYIYSFTNIEVVRKETDKSVKELLDSVGYQIYECKTNDDIHKFKKYYKFNEELCTFRDPHRIDNHHIFFIVKKNVDEIRRKDFDSPKREDEYSTSVLDLQFDKGEKQRVSIKSRYNHTVSNPDAVYSNNLERIVPGLTYAFEKEFGFNIGYEYATNFELDHYTEANDGKLYKYNYEINNVHYCPDNIIIDNRRVISDYKDKGRYTLIDQFLLDEKEKSMSFYGSKYSLIQDSFLDAFNNITNINIVNKDENREIIITVEDKHKAIIKIDSDNRIIEYKNNFVTSVNSNFLFKNKSLLKLELPNLVSCKSSFLEFNTSLEELSLPSLEKCGQYFLFWNLELKSIYLPALKECGIEFMTYNDSLKEINLPSLEKCEDGFMFQNYSLEKASFPSLKKCGDGFLGQNERLSYIYLPSLVECGHAFLNHNISLKSIDFPKLRKVKGSFLYNNEIIEKVNMPHLKSVGHCFLDSNKMLKSLNLPSLEVCGNGFVDNNNLITELKLPKLISCGYYFLSKNNIIKELFLPNLEECGEHFFSSDIVLNNIQLPKLKKYFYDRIPGDKHGI